MGISRRNFRALNITFCLGSQIASYTQRHAPASPGAAHLRCCAPGWDATAPSELSASTPLRIAPSALMFSRKRCTIANNISIRASPQTEEQIRTPCLKSAVVHGPPAPTARSTAANQPAASKRRPHLSPGRASPGRRRCEPWLPIEHNAEDTGNCMRRRVHVRNFGPITTASRPGQFAHAAPRPMVQAGKAARLRRFFVRHERRRRGPPQQIGPQPRRGGHILARSAPAPGDAGGAPARNNRAPLCISPPSLPSRRPLHRPDMHPADRTTIFL
jgi:hypothetical protein